MTALGRAGYPADTAPQEHIRLFGQWVESGRDRWLELLCPGEVLHGEWLALAHGTRYDLPHEPFVVFDLTIDGRRCSWDELLSRSSEAGFRHSQRHQRRSAGYGRRNPPRNRPNERTWSGRPRFS